MAQLLSFIYWGEFLIIESQSVVSGDTFQSLLSSTGY
jgi:hypothetical protein